MWTRGCVLTRERKQHSLLPVSASASWLVLRVLWFCVAALLPIHAQQTDSTERQLLRGGAVTEIYASAENPPAHAEESNEVSNPTAAVEPAWVTSRDSAGNVNQNIKVQSDFAVGDSARLGLLFGQDFVYNSLPRSDIGTQDIRQAGVTSQWHPNDAVKFDAMVGVSQLGATTTNDGSIRQAFIPISKVQALFTPAGGVVKVDLQFKRFIFDLSPELVANRAVRNDFVLHPQISLPSGWRFRELAEMGPVTSTGESNARFNSESTVGHKLGKASELYSTYSTLHYAQPSNAGYFSPDLVQNIAGGWTTDLDRKSLSLSLDLGAGAGHARAHGSDFGPWGLSLEAQSYLTWSFDSGRELRASYEFYYDQSNPAVAAAPSGAWHMSVVTVSFRWARR